MGEAFRDKNSEISGLHQPTSQQLYYDALKWILYETPSIFSTLCNWMTLHLLSCLFVAHFRYLKCGGNNVLISLDYCENYM